MITNPLIKAVNDASYGTSSSVKKFQSLNAPYLDSINVTKKEFYIFNSAKVKPEADFIVFATDGLIKYKKDIREDIKISYIDAVIQGFIQSFVFSINGKLIKNKDIEIVITNRYDYILVKSSIVINTISFKTPIIRIPYNAIYNSNSKIIDDGVFDFELLNSADIDISVIEYQAIPEQTIPNYVIRNIGMDESKYISEKNVFIIKDDNLIPIKNIKILPSNIIYLQLDDLFTESITILSFSNNKANESNFIVEKNREEKIRHKNTIDELYTSIYNKYNNKSIVLEDDISLSNYPEALITGCDLERETDEIINISTLVLNDKTIDKTKDYILQTINIGKNNDFILAGRETPSLYKIYNNQVKKGISFNTINSIKLFNIGDNVSIVLYSDTSNLYAYTFNYSLNNDSIVNLYPIEIIINKEIYDIKTVRVGYNSFLLFYQDNASKLYSRLIIIEQGSYKLLPQEEYLISSDIVNCYSVDKNKDRVVLSISSNNRLTATIIEIKNDNSLTFHNSHILEMSAHNDIKMISYYDSIFILTKDISYTLFNISIIQNKIILNNKFIISNEYKNMKFHMMGGVPVLLYSKNINNNIRYTELDIRYKNQYGAIIDDNQDIIADIETYVDFIALGSNQIVYIPNDTEDLKLLNNSKLNDINDKISIISRYDKSLLKLDEFYKENLPYQVFSLTMSEFKSRIVDGKLTMNRRRNNKLCKPLIFVYGRLCGNYETVTYDIDSFTIDIDNLTEIEDKTNKRLVDNSDIRLVDIYLYYVDELDYVSDFSIDIINPEVSVYLKDKYDIFSNEYQFTEIKDKPHYRLFDSSKVAYPVQYTTTNKDEQIDYLVLEEDKYYNKPLKLVPKLYNFYKSYIITEECISFGLGEDFRYCNNPDRYMIFIDGLYMTKERFDILIPNIRNPYEEAIITSVAILTPGMKIDVFYLPFEFREIFYTKHIGTIINNNNSKGDIEDSVIDFNTIQCIKSHNNTKVSIINPETIEIETIGNLNNEYIEFKYELPSYDRYTLIVDGIEMDESIDKSKFSIEINRAIHTDKDDIRIDSIPFSNIIYGVSIYDGLYSNTSDKNRYIKIYLGDSTISSTKIKINTLLVIPGDKVRTSYYSRWNYLNIKNRSTPLNKYNNIFFFNGEKLECENIMSYDGDSIMTKYEQQGFNTNFSVIEIINHNHIFNYLSYIQSGSNKLLYDYQIKRDPALWNTFNEIIPSNMNVIDANTRKNNSGASLFYKSITRRQQLTTLYIEHYLEHGTSGIPNTYLYDKDVVEGIDRDGNIIINATNATENSRI